MTPEPRPLGPRHELRRLPIHEWVAEVVTWQGAMALATAIAPFTGAVVYVRQNPPTGRWLVGTSNHNWRSQR